VSKSFKDFSESPGVFFLLFFCLTFLFFDLFLFLKKLLSFDITTHYMVKNADIISFRFLLNLKNVNILRKLLDFFPCDTVDKSGLTNTIPPDKTILSPLNKFKLSLLQKSLATNDKSKICD